MIKVVDVNDTVMTLADAVSVIDKLRRGLLCDIDDSKYEGVETEQNWLLALGALDQAQRFARLADYKYKQSKAKKRKTKKKVQK